MNQRTTYPRELQCCSSCGSCGDGIDISHGTFLSELVEMSKIGSSRELDDDRVGDRWGHIGQL